MRLVLESNCSVSGSLLVTSNNQAQSLFKNIAGYRRKMAWQLDELETSYVTTFDLVTQ